MTSIQEEEQQSGSESSVENETTRDSFKINLEKMLTVVSAENMDGIIKCVLKLFDVK